MTTSAGPSAIIGLDPKPVWRFFAEIAGVPRPSKKEDKIRAHTKKLAQELGFQFREDRVGNLVIDVPATPGREGAPLTVLQGHFDMVCEKNAGTQHDFDNEPIHTIVDTDAKTGEPIVRADGTTLGADNGIGLALALGAATDPGVVHGPLEILCTIDEEMGMTGAGELEPGFVRGKRLLNLDSEDDTVLYIGCAGGGDITLMWEFKTAELPATVEVARVTVSGFRGGHSGGDIHENRGNAVKALVRTLTEAGLARMQIVTMAGGSKRNALAREASAVVAGGQKLINVLKKAATKVRDAVAHEAAEPGAAISVEPVGKEQTLRALTPVDSRRLLAALTALPHGVMEMHTKVAGLVQTSNNVATIACEPIEGGAKLRVVVGCLSRSSVQGRLDATRNQIAAVGQLSGAEVEFGHAYPGWEPNVDSRLLATCKQVFHNLVGGEPKVAAIHAGLECGIIGQRLGNMDMISFGPHITGAHSPDERVYVNSVQRSYKFLSALLAELAKG